MDLIIYLTIGGFIVLALGTAVGYYTRQSIAVKQSGTLEAKINTLVAEAKKEAEETVLKAKRNAVEILEEAKRDERERLRQVTLREERLSKKEELVEEKTERVDHERELLRRKAEEVKSIRQNVEVLHRDAEERLLKTADMTKEEAKTRLIKTIEQEYRADLLGAVQKLERERKEELERKSFQIMTAAIQRYARSHVAEVTTSVVNLADNELKGRIIGREGRNIRALERATGVEIIVDDTPGAITLSAFDPIRREVAKITLEKLLADGRIQPARIEEKVEEAREELKKRLQRAGEEACYEVGILDLPQPVVHLLGRLSYRTSFGQNVLLHSIEATHLAGMLAYELGAHVDVAKKGALLHDIGKAVDHEIQGTHVELGRKILEKYGVGEAVIHAMEAHHEEYPFATPEAFIVTAAEAISAARPGARKDTVENYIKRLEDLERIANAHAGTERSYAIQAGRELRVFVQPERIDDYGALEMARTIAKRIEEELKYPGEIKVNVIRETRAVEYAR
ncbi:MAG: ribonuclease Y [bacterium]|nr:ribonuclease Y [bacterium]MDZ4296580.1 ribonuclease Y [Patescibacteria group bacterium]